MKINKAGFWVSLALAIATLVAGIVIMLLPSNCPVGLDRVSASSAGSGRISINITLTNRSDEDVYVSKLVVVVKTSGDTIQATDSEGFTLEAGTTYDLSYSTNSYDRPQSVSKVTITTNGKSYVVHGTNVPIASILLLVAAFICAIIAISIFSNNRRKKKTYSNVVQALPQIGDNAITFNGFYSKKGETGKAVGKSVLSVLGGALLSLFVGIGFFRIYGKGTAVDLIVGDNGLYVLNNANSCSSMFIEKGHFPASEITVKKRNVTLTNTITQEYFVFKTTKNGITPEQLVEKLKALTAALPEQTEKVDTEAPAPFEELSGENVTSAPAPSEVAETAVADSTPAESDTPEEK